MNAIYEQSNTASGLSRFMDFFHRICPLAARPQFVRYRVAPRIGDHRLADRLRRTLGRRLRSQDINLAGLTGTRRPPAVP